jgi:cobalt/nickel transport system permease protein
MALLLLISTTSYVDIFSFLSLFLPSLLVDIFLFTYRALFILFDRFENLLKSIRLKGGFHPLRLLLNMRNTSGMLGVLLIHCIDMGERMYWIYSLRGYGGHIPLSQSPFALKPTDFLLVSGAVIILTGMVIPWSL